MLNYANPLMRTTTIYMYLSEVDAYKHADFLKRIMERAIVTNMRFHNRVSFSSHYFIYQLES